MENLTTPSYFTVNLSLEEKIKCLEEILNKFKKILYVYDKSLEDSSYNYKVYCGGVLLYVSSSNQLFNGGLVNLVVNLNSIVGSDLEKTQIKRLVFESRSFIEGLIQEYNEQLALKQDK